MIEYPASATEVELAASARARLCQVYRTGSYWQKNGTGVAL